MSGEANNGNSRHGFCVFPIEDVIGHTYLELPMIKYIPIITLSLLSSVAMAERAPAPQTLIMFGVDAFSNGQSNNLGPAIMQTIKEYWDKGACTDTDFYAKCDALQFGLAAYPNVACGDSLVYYEYPQEDGGDKVEDVIKTVHTEKGVTMCADGQYRPHDAGLRIHRTTTFPLEEAAPDPVQDLWWKHPHLALKIVGDLPQRANADLDGRVKKTLQEACLNLKGGAGGTLPAIPTWVMMFRKAGETPVPYGHLLAAAGGSGVCCYGKDCDRSDSTKRIDVCAHVNEVGRTDAKIRTDLADGLYNCGAGDRIHEVGAMAFPNAGGPFGKLPDIRCHLWGEKTSTKPGEGSCDDGVGTDILGLFSCIRQLPRGVSAEDATIMACPEKYASLDECKKLGKDDISFIDEKKTLFVINDRDYCDGTWNFEITTCPLEGSPCVVDGAKGRCAVGVYECINGEDVCVSVYEPMPEICNGLDDDCTGQIDNMNNSWQNFSYTLPSEFVGLDCRQNQVCRCPDGPDSYGGVDFLSYLQSWSGGCLCGEGVEAPGSSPIVEPTEPQASCANAATTPSAIVLILLGFLGIGARRFARSRG